jgi:hypothetical protein
MMKVCLKKVENKKKFNSPFVSILKFWLKSIQWYSRQSTTVIAADTSSLLELATTGAGTRQACPIVFRLTDLA